MVRAFAHGVMGHLIDLSWATSHSSQCTTTGLAKAVVCIILSGMMHIKEPLLILPSFTLSTSNISLRSLFLSLTFIIVSWLVTGNVTFKYFILNLIIGFNFGFVDIVKIKWSVFLWTRLWYVSFEKCRVFYCKITGLSQTCLLSNKRLNSLSP